MENTITREKALQYLGIKISEHRQKTRLTHPQIWEKPKAELSPHEILLRHPRLCAHMICESIGYLSEIPAAISLLSYLRGTGIATERNMHWQGTHYQRTGNQISLLEISKIQITDSFKFRHNHLGYMAEYAHALFSIERELNWNQNNHPQALENIAA